MTNNSFPKVRRWALSLSIAVCLFVVELIPAISAQDFVGAPVPVIDYTKDVAPIFEKRCNHCHGATKQSSDLRLDLRAAILKGGGNGEIVRVGDAASSRLIQVVTGHDSDYVMPPEGERLSRDDVQTIRNWIDQGAQGPDDAAELRRRLPWSFQPIVRPLSDASSDKTAAMQRKMIGGDVDSFLIRQLSERGLTYSPSADRRTLIRRLFLIVLGVPPVPAEVQQFVDDDSLDAYESLVDRVLADIRYGERMARHWFDVVRFAESHGFETNRVRYNAWPYRDYVIQAFNSDTPYDRFIVEQISGDSIGVDAATGFLVAGTYDLVKSPDINLTLAQRQDELADLINTTGTAFLGLTLGCARCHDHKFDPITQVDFYALQAVFAGVNFGERPIPINSNLESQNRIREIVQELESCDKEVARVIALAKNAPPKTDTTGLLPEVNSKINEESFSPVLATAVRFTVQFSGDSQPCIDEWEVFNTKGDNVALSSAGAIASASSALPGYSIHKIEHVNDGKTGNDFSWISNEVNGGVVRIDFAQPETIVRMNWGRDRLERFRDRLASQYSIEALCDGQWLEIASSRQHKPTGANMMQFLISQLSADEQLAYQKALQAKKSFNEELAILSGGQTAWLGVFSQPSPIHRLHRGDPLLKREEVAPAMVASLGGVPMPHETREHERRRAMANWLTDSKNPLTPRVIVNRLWHYTFGTGLVDTPSDFGANGSLPSHPELLDWLSDELISSGWSLKRIHKLLLLSNAFRQSSKPSSQGLEVDTDARMLWRFPPRRLEAEAIRDSMLACSGEIHWQMGGPGFFLQQVEKDNVYRYFSKDEYGKDESRRMVYLTRIRGEQDLVFGSFDCPNGNQVIPKRSRSNTPLQALNLFNSRFVEQQSERLASRLTRESLMKTDSFGPSVHFESATDQQIQLAFELLVSRKPDQYELAVSRKMIESEGLVAFCRAMLNLTEFLFVF